ncbi:motile sperm domain-containing protein 2-like [Contarinia nasturtii]|uniref:motile sperm domain-containing protein 2-like n=1 Tax=Contarinia nasturtii TaxID=265458 RepID=UPI0012D3998B|nr:motile sperm domain-containing protein 2-like [Contarinia nasturtii]
MPSKAIFLTPTITQIEELRTNFFERLEREGAPCEGGFHPKDIDRIKSTNIWLQKFLEQHDLDMKEALKMLWDTCEWRKNYGANDISEKNINMDYIHEGLMFPRNRDIDGKVVLVLKSKQHVRGLRDTEQLLRNFIYWIERLNKEENYDTISVFFDLAGTGLKNLDLDYTKQFVHLLKYYYPNNLNYIFVYELPWILNAAFNIIKALLPAKAVASLRFVNSKNLGEYMTEENMLTCWGGKDDYHFKFEPSKLTHANEFDSNMNGQKGIIIPKDENDNTTVINHEKKVTFAKTSSVSEIPMSDQSFGRNTENGGGNMLKIAPAEIITFSKVGTELIGSVDIFNIVKYPITYKIKTTSPEKFRVRPSTGILTPGSAVNISVVLQSGPNVTLLLNKDKFLVMCMEINDLNASQQDIADIWKNTQNNSLSVEQHRLKCSLGPNVNLNASNTIVGDMSKNSSMFLNNGGVIDTDRQWLHVSNSVSQLVETTRRLETRIKFNQKLQWITVFVFLLLSIAIVYILKIEINNNSSEYCMKSTRGYK